VGGVLDIITYQWPIIDNLYSPLTGRNNIKKTHKDNAKRT